MNYRSILSMHAERQITNLFCKTLFYSVSFYFVYFSCTAQICTLKFKSEYYLRINRKSCQKCEHRQSHFDFLKNAYPVSLFLRNNSLVKQFQHSICISSMKTKTITEISFSFELTLVYSVSLS